MGKIVVEGTDEELKRVTGPAGVKVSAFVEPDASELDEKAKLAEEVRGQIAEKDTEIATLKEENVRLKGELEAKLAEEPVEETDEERFTDLVEGIQSLAPAGKARLAEVATGWTYREPELAPVIVEPTPVVATVDPEPVKRRRIIIIPKK